MLGLRRVATAEDPVKYGTVYLIFTALICILFILRQLFLHVYSPPNREAVLKADNIAVSGLFHPKSIATNAKLPKQAPRFHLDAAQRPGSVSQPISALMKLWDAGQKILSEDPQPK